MFVEVSSDHNCGITGVANDSRQVVPGDVFVACPGITVDGRDFIKQAVENGAAAIVYHDDEKAPTLPSELKIPCLACPDLTRLQGQIAARFYGNPAEKMQVIGVTGTNGKTSITHFIAQALEQHHKHCAVMGTLGTGFLNNLSPSDMTTADPIALQKNITELREKKADSLAMEVSSHALAQHRVEGVDIDTAIFTQLSRDHLDYHGSMQAYAEAKKLLFRMSSVKRCVLNFDHELGRLIAEEQAEHKRIITYSIEGRSDERFPAVTAYDIKALKTGFTAKVETPWGCGTLCTSLLGRFNVSNLMAVVATLGSMDIPVERIFTYLENTTTIMGRMQVLGGNEAPLVVVDYSHTPHSLQQALKSLREHCEGQVWCVFGCGGDRDAGKRQQMGTVADHLSEHIIVTNDNPRSESPDDIAADILQGISNPKKVMLELDRAVAIEYAIQSASLDDMILIAGKGHERYQIIGDEKNPFSDIEHVQQQLSVRVD